MHFGPYCIYWRGFENFHIFSKSARKIVKLYRSSLITLILEIINMIIDIIIYFGTVVQNTPPPNTSLGILTPPPTPPKWSIKL